MLIQVDLRGNPAIGLAGHQAVQRHDQADVVILDNDASGCGGGGGESDHDGEGGDGRQPL